MQLLAAPTCLQKMDRHTEHTKPMSMEVLWQKHEARKSTPSGWCRLSFWRVRVSALRLWTRSCSVAERVAGRKYSPSVRCAAWGGRDGGTEVQPLGEMRRLGAARWGKRRSATAQQLTRYCCLPQPPCSQQYYDNPSGAAA